jgi:4-amino-4-deoxy-L-arabinose transferase-like glycosyltransferase
MSSRSIGSDRLSLLALLLGVTAAFTVSVDGRGEFLPTAFTVAACSAALAWLSVQLAFRVAMTVTALAIALLWFGAAERSPVSIRGDGERLTVRLNEGTVQVAQPRGLREVALRQDVDNASYATVPGVPRAIDLRRVPLAGGALDLVANGNLLSAVTGVRAGGEILSLTDPASVFWQPLRTEGDETITGPRPRLGVIAAAGAGFRPIASIQGNRFTLDLALLRPGPRVRLLLAGETRTLEVVLYSEHSGITVSEVTSRGDRVNLVSGPLLARKDLLQSCQQLLRVVARALLTSIVLTSLLLTAGGLLARCVPWRPGLPWPIGDGAAPRRLALAVALIGTVVTAMVASEVLERMPHVQDSVAYLFQAGTFALGRISVPAPPVADAFAQEFVLVHNGQWFSKYPPGHPVVLAIGVLAGAPWLVSPIAAGLALLLTYALGRELYGRGKGLLAQVLLVTSPFFVVMSGSMMSHATSLVFGMTFIWLAIVARREQAAWAGLGSGLALGMLGASRALTAIGLSVPTLLLLAVELVRSRRIRVWQLALAAGAALPTLGVLAYNRALTGSALVHPFELWWSFDRVGFGETVGMHGGHHLAWGLVNVWANLTELQRWLFGWPAQLTFVLALVPFVSGSRRGSDWLLGATAFSVMAVYVFYWADGIMYGPRYYYELVGILVLLSARGVSRIGELASALYGGLSGARHAAQAATSATVGALIVVTSTLQTPMFLRAVHGYNGMDRARVDAVSRSGLHRALVLVADSRSSWQTYGSVFWANAPLLDSDVIYARDLGEASNRRLVRAVPGRAAYRLVGSSLSPYQLGGGH